MYQARLRIGAIVLLAALLLALAAALRVYGLDFGLPYALHPDEARFVGVAVKTLQTGDLDPDWFRQPSLHTNLVSATLAAYFVWSGTRGQMTSVDELFRPDQAFRGLIPRPSEWLAARLLTAVLGVLTVALAGYYAWRWYGGWAGWLAGLLLATAPLHVANSHFISADVLAGLLAFATIGAAVPIAERGRVRDDALAGLCAGLAASAKYNVGLVWLVIPAAQLVHWASSGRRPHPARLALAAAAAVAGFLLGTPFALLNLPVFLNDLVWELNHHVVVGHEGVEGSSLWYYTRALALTANRWLAALGGLGLLLGIWPGAAPAQRRATLVVGAYVVPFSLLLALTPVHFDRFLVPLLAPLAVLGGFALARLAGVLGALAARQASLRRRVAIGLGMALAALFVFGDPLAASYAYGERLSQPDITESSRDWILANVPPGAGIVVERYAPALDESRYQLLEVGRLDDYQADWYREQGYVWFVAAQANYQRYLDAPDRYPKQAAAYQALFAGWELVQTIEGASMGRPGFHIRVYRAGR